ncbi:MAG TPA: hypothetical protein VFC73_04835 [Syntrophomonadaceae bacterium]|nr:hypothetical protein [Syntrophomonadaceae bacterium]
MVKGKREENIKRIILLEDRIIDCERCPTSLQCIRKPSLGKGDLVPDAVLIFESDKNCIEDISDIIEIRKTISTNLGIKSIYHTFLVRCQPKSCTCLNNINCYGGRKLIDKEYDCILNNKKCSGIPINPSDEQIVSCMPFVIEEIEILKPSYIFLFGERVIDFMLKSLGVFNDYKIPTVIHVDDTSLVLLDSEEYFDSDYCAQIKI